MRIDLSKRAIAVLAAAVLAVVTVVTVIVLRPWETGAEAPRSEGVPGGPTIGTDVALGRFAAATGHDDVVVSVEAAPLDETARSELVGLNSLGVLAGVPVEVTLADGDFPDSGITLTRTYPEPLPADAVAGWMYFDENVKTWIAYPSTISTDRRTVTAVVDHLSWWTDVVSATSEAATAVRDAATRAGRAVVDGVTVIAQTGAEYASTAAAHIDSFIDYVGEQSAEAIENIYATVAGALSVRADPPRCGAENAEWILNATYPATNANDPVLFCAAEDANLLGVQLAKARVNRGFGFVANLAGGTDASERVETEWTYNETLDPEVWSSLVDIVTDLPRVLGTSTDSLTNGIAHFVGPGDEFAFGVSEEQVRDLEGGHVSLEMAPTNAVGAATSIIGRTVIDHSFGEAEPWLWLLSLMAKCATDVSSADDIPSAAKATVSCFAAIAHGSANATYDYLTEIADHVNREAGETIMTTTQSKFRAIMKKAGLAMLIASAVIEGADYATALATEALHRTVALTALPAVTGSGSQHTADQASAFVTPSGNITCLINTTIENRVRCDILEYDYTPPPKPASCPLDYGASIELSNTISNFLCYGDTLYGLAEGPSYTTWRGSATEFRSPADNTFSGAVLGYGESLTVEGATCTSAESGVTCHDSFSSFSLSRGNYDSDD